ncbi:hypothetical protein, partial [Pectobacterium brasiliense]|uniref:hypothetical protein n=2 Tax=Pectobacterium TaxID=122277 RepID=UPI001C5CF95A
SSLLPRSPASATRPGVAWSCKPAASLLHGAPERRRPTLADSLPPAPAEPARLPQTSCGSRAGCRGKPPKDKTTNGSGLRRCYDVAQADREVTAWR